MGIIGSLMKATSVDYFYSDGHEPLQQPSANAMDRGEKAPGARRRRNVKQRFLKFY